VQSGTSRLVPVSAQGPSDGAYDVDDLQQLAPHLVGRARRGVVGSSRYARKLREEICAAARDPSRRPVLISGEPGLEKDNLAALVHFGSPDRQQLMLRFDGALLRPDGSELFGGHDHGSLLLELLGRGALLIDKLDQAPAPLQNKLLELASSKAFERRLFFTAEQALPAFDRCCTQIRVPPLRVRRRDLGEWLRYGVRQRSRKLGWTTPPQVSEAVVKRLQSYDFPNNIRELETLIYRALQQVRRQEPSWQPEPGWSPHNDQRIARRRLLDAGTSAALSLRHLALEASAQGVDARAMALEHVVIRPGQLGVCARQPMAVARTPGPGP